MYNDVFHISAEGHFATINGLRLGRLPTCQVDWNEINAALGHCVLLLDVLATRLKYKYKKYNLIPFGSTSKVEIIADKSILELYGPVEFVRVMRKTRFNKALVGILTCLSELCQELYSRFGDASIPYKYAAHMQYNCAHSVDLQNPRRSHWRKFNNQCQG